MSFTDELGEPVSPQSDEPTLFWVSDKRLTRICAEVDRKYAAWCRRRGIDPEVWSMRNQVNAGITERGKRARN